MYASDEDALCMEVDYDDSMFIDFQHHQSHEINPQDATTEFRQSTQRAARSGRYGDTSILLDTGSTFSCVKIPKLILHIMKIKKTSRGAY